MKEIGAQRRVNGEKDSPLLRQKLVQQLVREAGWLHWQPLQECLRGAAIAATSGLYRIRCVLTLETMLYTQVLYIGQSSDLHVRLGMLADVFRSDMPYRTPHVAGPGLWSLLHHARLEHRKLALEASVLPLGEAISKAERLGYEALAIGVHRQHYGTSPAFNCGKMLRGYVLSSYNTGPEKSYRGTPSPLRDKSHLPSLAPAGPLVSRGGLMGRNWCGHRWSDWVAAPSIELAKGNVGLYRIRFSTECEGALLYVGAGKLRDRLKQYRQQKALECSWAVKSACAQGYQEYVDDAIASHVLATSLPPAWQFEQGARAIH